MSLSITGQFTRLLNAGEKLTTSLFNTILSSLSFTVSGTAGNSDLTSSAVKANVTVPDAYWFATGVYSAGVYSVSLNAALVAYTPGLVIAFKADTANTGAANVNVNAIGSVDLLKENGRELDAGDLPLGWIVEARYNGTAFQVVSVTAKPVLIRGGTFTNGATVNDFQMTLTPGTLTLPLLVGLAIEGIVLADTTGPVNIVITPLGSSALAAKALVRNGATALATGDLKAGQYIRFIWDGTNYQLQNPTPAPGTAAVIADGRRVVVQVLTGSAVSVTADELILKTSAGDSYVARNLAVGANISTVGVDGSEDGGSDNTWYGIYVIRNAAGVLSCYLAKHPTSRSDVTLPTFPAGYTYFALVGFARDLITNNLLLSYQHDRVCYYNNASTPANVNVVNAATIPTSLTAYSLTAFVPPMAYECGGQVIDIHATADLEVQVADASQLFIQTLNAANSGTAFGGGYATLPWRAILTSAQSIYMASASTTPTYYVQMLWYRI